jgi:hypothetical protein
MFGQRTLSDRLPEMIDHISGDLSREIVVSKFEPRDAQVKFCVS